MVELLVGVVLLAVVALSLAASSLYASRAIRRARIELEAAEFQQRELERLLAVPYAALASGERAMPKGKSAWTVEDSVSYRRVLLITSYTPSEAISIGDTVVTYLVRP